jgi:hypothetical protein
LATVVSGDVRQLTKDIYVGAVAREKERSLVSRKELSPRYL